MERNEQILKSCKIIQREINRLLTLDCVIDLAYHNLNCYDHTIKPEKTAWTVERTNEDFTNQIVFQFNLNK